MQVDDNQQFIEKRNVLMNAVSKVVNNLLKQSGKSGRKISQEKLHGKTHADFCRIKAKRNL